MSLGHIKTNSLNCVAFDPQGAYLMAAGGAMVRDGNKSTTFEELIAWDVPGGQLRWHVVKPAKSRVAGLTISPDGKEFVTTSTETQAVVWKAARPTPLRKIPVEFLCGDVVISPDGKTFLAPADSPLKLRSFKNGRITASIEITSSPYTTARAAAFLPGGDQLVVACRFIDAKGGKSGLLLLVSVADGQIIRKAAIDVNPARLDVDPQGRWVCVGGERKGRGHVAFWSTAALKQLGGCGAHGRHVDDVKASPDGKLVATCGADNVIRLWSTDSWKTVAKLDEHVCEGSGSSGVAWSPDAKLLAYANASGAPPAGGVFVYEHRDGAWQLTADCRAAASPQPGGEDQPPRHVQIFGPEAEMDTYGNFSVPANPLPVRCPHCTFPDIDAVAQPYLLRRGMTAPGDFATAQMGNFFVREPARRILEVVAPRACKFYATAHYQTGQPTDWLLAVPQTQVPTARLRGNVPHCPVCSQPKVAADLEDLAFDPPQVDLFKSQQWRSSSKTGEEAKWYWMHILKAKAAPKVPQGQWTRVQLRRDLWFSVRLALLFKELGISGFPYRDLEQRRATEAEAAWIAEQVRLLKSGKTDAKRPATLSKAATPSKATSKAVSGETAKWFNRFLKDNASTKPLGTAAELKAWSKKHGIELPRDYRRCVTRIGRKTFRDLAGREGLDARIVGPNQLDADSFRRDSPDPDGLLFAVAGNGDCLCFDLSANAPDYAVVYFDHETETFLPYANNYAEALQRLVRGE